MTYLYFGTMTDDRSIVKHCNKTSREQPYLWFENIYCS